MTAGIMILAVLLLIVMKNGNKSVIFLFVSGILFLAVLLLMVIKADDDWFNVCVCCFASF